MDMDITKHVEAELVQLVLPEKTNQSKEMLPFHSIFLLGISSCYSHVVENTVTIGSTAHTVVSRWSGTET